MKIVIGDNWNGVFRVLRPISIESKNQQIKYENGLQIGP